MFRLASLFVEIGANTQGLNTALAGIHARLLGIGSIGQAASQGLHSLAMGFTALEGAIGGLGMTILAGLGMAAVTGLAHCAMEAAHLQEAVAKVEQAFGTASPKVLAMADELAKKFGVVNKEVLDVAASFGLMLQGSGVARDMSADMSIALSKTAVDVASYFDISMQEAIQRMQSGLSGEMEAVRRFGINLSETNIKRQGQAMGFGSGELDQETKTLIRFMILMKGFSAAADDAERSQYRLIGQLKKFTGQIYTFAVNLGTLVTPVFTAILITTNATLEFINAKFTWFFTYLKAGALWLDSIFGTDLTGAKAAAAGEATTDERTKKIQEDMQKDKEAALKAGAHQPKGWRGGLEDFAKKVQESAWGSGKHKTAEDQLKTQKAMEKLLEEIKRNTKPAGSPPPPIPSFP
jgi:hypothetical protein